ncbi:MAG: hypothetical protein EXS32_10230 [Opitutus sp.]|nr:hypothetical protein [Opitutus sp.]
MKKISALLLTCTLAIPLSAQSAAPKATPAAVTLPAAAAVLSAPLALKAGVIAQPETTELTGGGKAVFEFTITTAGEYVIHAVVNATGEEENSFFLNIDAQPEDPLMIWDIDVTKGFEERIVSWRGNGDGNNDEFAPKRFKLSAGPHKLILVGREPTQLKSLSIRLAAK